MSTKYFCDLCDSPAVKPELFFETKAPEVGKTTTIEMRINIGLADHPSGYGGPPDLCAGCFEKLLAKLIKKVCK